MIVSWHFEQSTFALRLLETCAKSRAVDSSPLASTLIAHLAAQNASFPRKATIIEHDSKKYKPPNFTFLASSTDKSPRAAKTKHPT